MTYDSILWCEDGLWTAHATAMSGCYGVGRTKKSALSDLESAIVEMTVHQRAFGVTPKKTRRSEIVKLHVKGRARKPPGLSFSVE